MLLSSGCSLGGPCPWSGMDPIRNKHSRALIEQELGSRSGVHHEVCANLIANADVEVCWVKINRHMLLLLL